MTAMIRTFRAPDARSALAAVKAALGGEAVILGTKEVRTGFFGRAEVEVTAALSHETATPVRPPPAAVAVKQVIAPPSHALTDEVISLRSTLEQMRNELRTVADNSRAGHQLQLAPAAASLFAHLVDRGIENGLAEELVRLAMDGAATPHPMHLWSRVRERVAERLVPSRAPWLADRRRVIALVGPTGIGKTTTLAKIAARALMESRTKVALITVDTYRVGASEQIARYGEIMRVPTFVATNAAELNRAVERCASAELVLIDTAGRSLNEAVAQQAAMVRAIPGVQLYLVLSAATGARELAASAERYRALNPQRLIFTKLDEAAAPGGVLSASIRIGKPVPCLADGQRVPEDLHPATETGLVDWVLGQWNAVEPALRAVGR